MTKKSIVDKINDTFSGQHKNIVCDWYFNQIACYLKNKNVLDYGSGNASITKFYNVCTSDIVPNNFNNETSLDFIIDSTTGKLNTDKTFDVITVLRNYILYSDIEHFLRVINYLTTRLNSNGIILVGKHTIYDDFGDWNTQIEEWLNENTHTVNNDITTFWIIHENTFNSNAAT